MGSAFGVTIPRERVSRRKHSQRPCVFCPFHFILGISSGTLASVFVSETRGSRVNCDADARLIVCKRKPSEPIFARSDARRDTHDPAFLAVCVYSLVAELHMLTIAIAYFLFFQAPDVRKRISPVSRRADTPASPSVPCQLTRKKPVPPPPSYRNGTLACLGRRYVLYLQ